MTWFRSQIKRGAGLALIALALQLLLSFGHHHGLGVASASPSWAKLVAAPVTPAPDRDSDHAADLCAICATVAMTNAALFASPPPLPLPPAARLSDPAPEASAVRLLSPHGAFQARAPPVS